MIFQQQVAMVGLNAGGLPSNVVAQLSFQGANGSTTFTDDTGRVWTAAGNAQISTAQAPSGSSSSLFCDGTGDWISTTGNVNAFKIAANTSFEFECDLRLVGSGAQQIFAHYSSASGTNGGFGFSVDASRRLQLSRAGVAVVLTGSTTLTQNTWYRVKGSRTATGANNCKVFINNVQDGQVTDTASWSDSGSSTPASIGAVLSGGTAPLNGYIANLTFKVGG